MKESVSKLTLKNKLAQSPVLTRSYYPDYTSLLTRLFSLKAQIKDGGLTDKNVIHDQLISAMQSAENLGIYYDYCNNTNYSDENGIYGARIGAHGIGGGKDYPSVDLPACTASNDDELHDALPDLKEGQILLVTKDSCLELTDFLLAGDIDGFEGERIPYQWTVEEGRTWLGERGVQGCGGAVLKFTSFTDCAILMGKNARLSGLVIQGPDRPVDKNNFDYNFSVGIVVKGDGAVIENCEISGFYRAGIRVVDSENVTVKNCYFHDIGSTASGYGVCLKNSCVEMSENLFSNVTSVASLSEGAKLSFIDNSDAGNMGGNYFVGNGVVSAHHNTFLSAVELCSDGISVLAENNLFAYAKDLYDSNVSGENFVNNVFDVNNPSLYTGNKLLSDRFTAIVPESNEALSYDASVRLPVLSSCYYNETNDIGYALIKKWLSDGLSDGQNAVDCLNDIIAAIAEYTNYLTYMDKELVTFEVDGQRYGALSDGDMIGGGYDYSRIVTTGDYVVTNEDQLRQALSVAKAGEVVFMPGGTYINISDATENKVRVLKVPAGVTLASDRGFVREDGTVSTGAVIASSALYNDYILFADGENARLTGFVLRGPDPARHVAHHTRAFFRERGNKTLAKYYWALKLTFGICCKYSNIECDNLEISGFSTVGLAINNKENPPKDVFVHHNYVHHCQIKGLGYGVRFDFGFADVKYNMFNYNRHSIAGGGYAQSGYIAENNIEMGESLDHYCDMHGGRDRGDGTDIAGGYVEIRYCSFLGKWRPFVLRGRPEDHQDFSFNVVYDKIETSGPPLINSCGERVENALVGKNAWEISRGIIEILDGVNL